MKKVISITLLGLFLAAICLCTTACAEQEVIVFPSENIVNIPPTSFPANIMPDTTNVIVPSNEPTVIIPSYNDSLADAIIRLTNAERLDRYLEPLSYNYELQEAADIRAKEIAQVFSHTRPDGSSCHSIVEDMDYYVTGENIILADKQIATAENLVNAWMNSEGHRYNILLADFTSIAVGVYRTNNTVFAVQIFMG